MKMALTYVANLFSDFSKIDWRFDDLPPRPAGINMGFDADVGNWLNEQLAGYAQILTDVSDAIVADEDYHGASPIDIWGWISAFCSTDYKLVATEIDELITAMVTVNWKQASLDLTHGEPDQPLLKSRYEFLFEVQKSVVHVHEFSVDDLPKIKSFVGRVRDGLPAKPTTGSNPPSCNPGALTALFSPLGLILPDVGGFVLANIQDWRWKRVIEGAADLVLNVGDMDWQVRIFKCYRCTWVHTICASDRPLY